MSKKVDAPDDYIEQPTLSKQEISSPRMQETPKPLYQLEKRFSIWRCKYCNRITYSKFVECDSGNDRKIIRVCGRCQARSEYKNNLLEIIFIIIYICLFIIILYWGYVYCCHRDLNVIVNFFETHLLKMRRLFVS